MNRLLLPALWVTLGLPLSAQADPLTLQLPVGPVYRIVDTIAEKTGMTLRVDSEMSRDILFVDVKDVEAQVLLDKIATATAGRWRKLADGSMVLSNDPATLNRRETAARQKRAELLGKSLQTQIEETLKSWYAPPPTKKPNPDEEWSDEMYVASPGRFLLAKCAQQLSTGILAAMQPGDRIVYSTTPTRMQQRLSLSNEVVREFLVAYNRMATAQEGADVPPGPEETGSSERELMEAAFGQWTMKRSPQKEVPSKVLLIASRPTTSMFSFLGEGGGTVMLDLLVLDQKGNVIENESIPLGEQNWLTEAMGAMTAAAAESVETLEGGPGTDEAQVEAGPDETKTEGAMAGADPDESVEDEPDVEDKPKFPIKSGEIEYSDKTKLFMKIGGETGMAEIMTPKVPDELRPLLLDPDLHDPLGYNVEDSLRSLAKHASWSVVANLSDQTTGTSFMGLSRRSQQTTQQFYDQLRTTYHYSADQEGTWLTLFPESLTQVRATRVNRVALKKFLAQAAAGVTPSLDELSEYAATSPDFRNSQFVAMHLLAANPGLLGMSMMGSQNWDVLRALGSLSRTQRDNARNGIAISMRGLTTSQSNAFRTLIFGADYRTRPLNQLKAKDPVTSMMEMFSGGMMGRGNTKDYTGEPTEALPWGIPSEATITLQFEQDDVFKITGDEPMFNFFPNMGTTELAMMNLFFQAAPPNSMGGQDFSKMMDNLMVGDREVITLRVNLGDLVGVQEKLTDDRLDSKKAKISIKSLSGNQKSKLDTAMESLKQHPIIKMMMREMKEQEGTGAGGAPPKADP